MNNGTRKRITLCGSTRFKLAYLEWNARLTLDEGAVVYSVAMWSHTKHVEPTDEQKRELDLIHKAKIDNSDEIFVLDVGGYIGESTSSEIAHAVTTSKRVRFLSNEFPDWTESDCRYVQDVPPPQSPARDEGAVVSVTEGFDIYKGMIGRDFIFRGCDQFKGAMFEHTCGWAVRIGPKSSIESIADAIERHDCERDKDE